MWSDGRVVGVRRRIGGSVNPTVFNVAWLEEPAAPVGKGRYAHVRAVGRLANLKTVGVGGCWLEVVNSSVGTLSGTQLAEIGAAVGHEVGAVYVHL